MLTFNFFLTCDALKRQCYGITRLLIWKNKQKSNLKMHLKYVYILKLWQNSAFDLYVKPDIY